MFIRNVIKVMGILSLVSVTNMLPITPTLFISVHYRPKTSKWVVLSYLSSFLNNLLNPIFYLVVCKGARKAFVSVVPSYK